MPRFIVICGPTGVGKTSVMRELLRHEGFEYVTPYMDRPLRTGETDKTSVSPDAFDRMTEVGWFCAVNGLYGNRYGTETARIEAILGRGQTALLDFPLKEIQKLSRWNPFVVYLLPPNGQELARRLHERGSSERIEQALQELMWFQKRGRQLYSGRIGRVIVNSSVEETVRRILA